jgi:hypothetical protein
MAKGAFNRKDSFYQQTGFKIKDETSEMLRLERSFFGAETWTLLKVDVK